MIFSYRTVKVFVLFLCLNLINSVAPRTVLPLRAQAVPKDISQSVKLAQPLTLQWQYESDKVVNLTPATDNARIYLPLAMGMVVALDAATGQIIWRTDTGGELSASPLADRHAVYLASKTVSPNGAGETGVLRAIDPTSGVTLWMRTLPHPLRGAMAVTNQFIFGGSSDGRVYALQIKNGQTAWTMQHSSAFTSAPVISGSYIYLGSDDGTFFAIDQATGKTTWRYRTQGAIRGRAAIVGETVYFGSADGYAYALKATTGERRWRARTGAAVQSVASVPQGLLVTSLDNFVYLLSPSNGDRIWKKQLAGRLAAQPLTSIDGALFTPLSSDAGVVLDLRDGKPLNRLPVGEDSNTMAAPVVAGELLVLTTRHGLLAFANSGHALTTRAN
jgi:outer membrane protein assembly factor BamB